MIRLSYDTDLTGDQWQILEPLIPAAKPGGRPRNLDIREVLNAIFYLLANGIKWRAMPHDLPKRIGSEKKSALMSARKSKDASEQFW